MISINNTKSFRELHYNDLLVGICDELNRLFTLGNKFQDDEKIKIFGEELANELPRRYPMMNLADLKQVFKNAIQGDYGELKISLPDIFKWVRKWQESIGTGHSLQPLASPQTTDQYTDWSHECYKAYQRYLQGGLKQYEISHFLYQRMLLDNFFPLEYYQKWMEKAGQMIQENNGSEIQIYCAQRISVLEKFNEIKGRGVAVIYQQHKESR